MADIAILVAEEYERRIKAGVADPAEIGSLVSSVSAAARSVKSRIGNGGDKYKYYTNVVVNKYVSQPKTQIALAASDGFFSA